MNTLIGIRMGITTGNANENFPHGNSYRNFSSSWGLRPLLNPKFSNKRKGTISEMMKYCEGGRTLAIYDRRDRKNEAITIFNFLDRKNE